MLCILEDNPLAAHQSCTDSRL